MPSQPLNLRDFQIRFRSGQIINEPIEKIRILDELVRIYGLVSIAKISFYFHDPQHKYHNLILRNTNYNSKIFPIEFYHYYNQQMERVELSTEEKVNDLLAVIYCMRFLRTRLHSLYY